MSTTVTSAISQSHGRAEQLRFWAWLGLLTSLLFVSITLAVVIGPVPIPARLVWQIAFSELFNRPEGDWSQA